MDFYQPTPAELGEEAAAEEARQHGAGLPTHSQGSAYLYASDYINQLAEQTGMPQKWADQLTARIVADVKSKTGIDLGRA